MSTTSGTPTSPTGATAAVSKFHYYSNEQYDFDLKHDFQNQWVIILVMSDAAVLTRDCFFLFLLLGFCFFVFCFCFKWVIIFVMSDATVLTRDWVCLLLFFVVFSFFVVFVAALFLFFIYFLMGDNLCHVRCNCIN